PVLARWGAIAGSPPRAAFASKRSSREPGSPTSPVLACWGGARHPILPGCYSPKMVFTANGLLLDMDGVLVDSAPAVERVWREWAVEHSLDPAMVVAQAHGRRSVETLRAVAPHIDAERENIIVEQREIEDKAGVTALPGADRLLRALPPARFA